jgi:hypothetical protein
VGQYFCRKRGALYLSRNKNALERIFRDNPVLYQYANRFLKELITDKGRAFPEGLLNAIQLDAKTFNIALKAALENDGDIHIGTVLVNANVWVKENRYNPETRDLKISEEQAVNSQVNYNKAKNNNNRAGYFTNIFKESISRSAKTQDFWFGTGKYAGRGLNGTLQFLSQRTDQKNQAKLPDDKIIATIIATIKEAPDHYESLKLQSQTSTSLLSRTSSSLLSTVLNSLREAHINLDSSKPPRGLLEQDVNIIKEELNKAYVEIIKKDLGPDTKILTKDSELGKFLDNPQEAAKKLKNLKQEIQATAYRHVKPINYISFLMQCDLDMLGKLVEVGRSIGHKQNVQEPQKKSFSGLEYALVAVALILGIVPGIIAAVHFHKKHTTEYNQQKEQYQKNFTDSIEAFSKSAEEINSISFKAATEWANKIVGNQRSGLEITKKEYHDILKTAAEEMLSSREWMCNK